MVISTYKMHGQGNDYIFLDCRNDKLLNGYSTHNSLYCSPNFKSFVQKITNRNFGIGGDGVVILENTVDDANDVFMRIFNVDGSEAESCGTALRCTAYLVDKYPATPLSHLEYSRNISSINIQTISGTKQAKICNKTNQITLRMGKAILKNKLSLNIDGLEIEGYLVNIGNPHFITFDDRLLYQYDNIWKAIEQHKTFQNRVNVQCVQLVNEHEITLKVWERGSGFTLACGSGSCACAFISHKIKNLKPDIIVSNPGGKVYVSVEKDDVCYLRGDTTFIFKTSINLKEPLWQLV